MHTIEDHIELGRRVRIGELSPEQAEAESKRYLEEDERESEALLGIAHVNGIPWHEAPLPRRWHRCRAQTYSLTVARCACGSIRMAGYRGWVERNSRRRG